MEKKPDGVECSPVLNYGSNTIAQLPAVIPNGQKWRPAVGAYGTFLYIVGGSTSSSFSASKNTITKINIKTGQIQTLSVTLPQNVSNSFYATVGSKLYILGGNTSSSNEAMSTVYIFDMQSETISTGTNMQYSVKRALGSYAPNSCVAVGNKIYIMGYSTGSASYSMNIIYYDTESGIAHDTGTDVYAIHPAVAAVGDIIYCFGSSTTGGSLWQMRYTYDTVKNVRSSTISYIYQYNAAISFTKYIYLFHGYYRKMLNTIELFDTEEKTFKTLELTSSVSCCAREICSNGSTIFTVGGMYSASDGISTVIDKLSLNTPLAKNNLFIREDYGYDFLWSAIKSKDADLKVKVINAYLGDSNNIAQPTNAYLYDTNTNQWKSLSGESYVADMQTALNILGVT